MPVRIGEVCAVKCVVPGAWPQYYLAHITGVDTDDEGTSIGKVRLVGEDFDRDSAIEAFGIYDEKKQAAAKKLAAEQWGRLKAWGEKSDDLKQAIINRSW